MLETHCHFPHLPKLDIKYLEEAEKGNYEARQLEPNSKFRPNTAQSPSSFIDSLFMKELREEFGNVRCHYIRTGPMECYDWHVDIARNCAILFVLNDVSDVVTLYRHPTPGIDYSEFKPLQGVTYQIEKVEYPLFRPVLLNVRYPHGVFNFSQRSRYVLTVGFTLDVWYDDVKEFLNNYQRLSY